MKDIHSVIREKEQQVRQLMEQIDKLRCAAQILEEEQNPLGVGEEMLRTASVPKPVETPRPEQAAVGKRVWP
jgi:regulator of replication initiation timing